MEKDCYISKVKKIFLIFLILYFANFILPMHNFPSYTSRMWIFMKLFSAILAVILIKNYKLPSKTHIGIALGLGLLMFVSYQGITFYSVLIFIMTTLCALASFSTFSRYPDSGVVILRNKNLKAILFSLLIGILTGIVLGIINLFLGNEALHFDFHLTCFLRALSPAIYEEICFRLVLYAYCLFLLRGVTSSKSAILWCYILMIVPHVLLHTPDLFMTGNLINWMISNIILCFLFGLPFAILQRKRDLTSAMIAHGLVDLIRFSFLGLPF